MRALTASTFFEGDEVLSLAGTLGFGRRFVVLRREKERRRRGREKLREKGYDDYA